LPVRNFLFPGLAKHALTVFIIVIQGLLETLPHRMGDDWSGDQLGVGCSRLAPASVPWLSKIVTWAMR
jgi:hypothetical protein